MSRPLSPSSTLRDRVDIYLTATEKLAISNKAKTAGLSVSAFIRKAALSQQIKATPRFALEKWGELARLGSNLNQVAKAIHSGQKLPFEPFLLLELEKAITDLRNELISDTTQGNSQ